MVQSSMMSAVQFLFRIALGLRDLLKKKPPPRRRAPRPSPPPSPSWSATKQGFVEYQGIHTSIKPVLPSSLETQPAAQPREGAKLYFIWRELVSPNYFSDLKKLLEVREGEERRSR